MNTDDLGARLAQRWVRVYTNRLPTNDAADRRDEILSDLWEHHVDSIQSNRSRLRHNLEVIERVLSGIPADLPASASSPPSRFSRSSAPD